MNTTEILVIDLHAIDKEFKDVGMYDIFNLVGNREEGDVWWFSTKQELEQDLLEVFEPALSTEMNVAIFDFETNEFSKLDIEITIEKKMVEKTTFKIKINRKKDETENEGIA